MPTFKYIVRKNKSSISKDGTTLIFLRFVHRGETCYFTTKKKVPVKDWDTTSQKVKRSYKGHSTINMYLSKFRQEMENHINIALLEGTEPTISYLKSTHAEKSNANGIRGKRLRSMNFQKFTENFIEESKLIKKPSTVRSYNDFLHILDQYQEARRIKHLDWSSFTLDWYYDFMEYYVHERGSSNNTFGKMIKTLKTFLNAAVDQGYNSNLQFRDKRFKVYQEDVSNIYLDEREIRSLLLTNGLNKKQIEIRDLFVIACYTGLRFSDFRQIKPKNISNDRLTIKTQKTGSVVVIPFHPHVKTLLQKYDGKLPNIYCNQTINLELKTIGKMAGFDAKIVKVRSFGVKRKEEVFQKWQLLSSHCARRSFATNLFKQGFPAISIMKITGHKSEKTFMKYIKVSESETADMLEKHWSLMSTK